MSQNNLEDMKYYLENFEQPKFYPGGKVAYKQASPELPIEYQNKGKEYAMEQWYSKQQAVEETPKVFPKKTLAYAQEFLGVGEKEEKVETPYSPVMPATPSLSECGVSPAPSIYDGADQEPVEEAVKEPVQESVAESVAEPVQESVEESVKESVAEPVQESVQESVEVSKPVEEPVKESVDEPKPVEEPIKEPKPVEEAVEEHVQESKTYEYEEKGDITLAELENEVKKYGMSLDETTTTTTTTTTPPKPSSSSLKRKIVESDDELSEMSDMEETPIKNLGKSTSAPKKKARVFGTSLKPSVKPSLTEKKRKQPGEGTRDEVKRLRNHTDLVIPKASFQRIVRASPVIPADFRFTETAMKNLQECTETRIMQILVKMKHAAEHAKRVTLNNSDLEVTLQIENRE